MRHLSKLCPALLFAAVVLIPVSSWACENPPVIRYFTATPTSITAGQAVTLQWAVDGTNVVNISNVGDVAPSGQAIVQPQANTTYVLTVPKDRTLAASVAVQVGQNTGAPANSQQPSQPTTPSQTAAAPAATVTLRYDNLDNSSEDYLATHQIAVWHTYAKMPGSPSIASASYSADIHRLSTTPSTTTVPVKSPLIILPFGDGMVCIVKSYSNLSYQLYKLGSAWYADSRDESEYLAQPGWGLMTTFSPQSTPFTIKKIDIAAAANDSDGSYDKYNFIVRILDKNGSQVWTKTLPWSLFKGDSQEGPPRAIWKSIDVDNVPVSGDFSVEVMSESNNFTTGRAPAYHYLALAYEEVNVKDATTRSIISEDGQKPDTWVRMYDPYGHPIGFNLCIRVEGAGPSN